MDDSPAYEIYKHSKRPVVNWDLKSGEWVGIWGYDWGNQLGEYITKNDDRFTFEVRQPDIRADKIYAHKFSSKTVHKLYPAKFNNRGKYVYSDELISDLTGIERKDTIVHTGVLGRFTTSFIDRLNVGAVIGSFHGEVILPIDSLFTLRKNVMNYRRVFSDHLKFKRLINNYDVLTYQTDYSISKLKKYYSGRLETATMGTDFRKFRILDKDVCRKELNLPPDANILISVGRINNIKRQAETVKELIKLNGAYNFIYIVLGHGTEKDEHLLREVSAPLIEKSKILMPGYIRDEQLVKYLNASDVFLMPSLSEAGPVASMEAAACGIPIITMDTGSVAKFLKKENAGVVVARDDFAAFGEAIEEFLNGKRINIADRKAAEEHFDWNVIAKKFIAIYTTALEQKKK